MNGYYTSIPNQSYVHQQISEMSGHVHLVSNKSHDHTEGASLVTSNDPESVTSSLTRSDQSSPQAPSHLYHGSSHRLVSADLFVFVLIRLLQFYRYIYIYRSNIWCVACTLDGHLSTAPIYAAPNQSHAHVCGVSI